MIQGIVRHAETGEGIAGIAVSNGWDIILSGEDGSFEIEVDLDRYPYVFVNTPAGFIADGSFYHCVTEHQLSEEPVEFRLAPDTTREKKKLRIAHVSDIHVGVESKPHFASPEEVAEDFQRVISQCEPDLIFATGDLTDLGRLEDLKAYKDVVDTLDVPVFSIYAGHDSIIEWITSEQGRDSVNQNYLDVFGVEQYSFDWGDYHFTLYPENFLHGKGRKERLAKWFEADLMMQSENKKIVVVTHDSPRVYPEAASETYGPSVTEILKNRGVILTLFGQYHCNRIIKWNDVIVSGATCLNFGSIDTSPRGYSVIELEGGNVEVEIHALKSQKVASAKSGNPAEALSGGTKRKLSRKWIQSFPCSFHRAEVQFLKDRIIMTASDVGKPENYGIRCLDLGSGRALWHVPTDSVIKNGVAVDDEECNAGVTVSVAGRIYKFSTEDGAIIWQQDLPTFPDRWIYSAPVIKDDSIFIATSSSHTALNLDSGEILWHCNRPRIVDNAQSALYQKPALHNDKLIYVQTTPLALVAVNTNDGDILWKKRLDWVDNTLVSHSEKYLNYWQQGVTSPIMAGDLIVSPGPADRLGVYHAETSQTCWQKPVLYAEGPASGATSGRYFTTSEFASGLTMHDGCIIAVTANGYVYSIDLLTGKRHWQTKTGSEPVMDMVPYNRGNANLLTRPIIFEGAAFVGGADGYLYAIDIENGSILEKTFFGSPITVSPLLTEKGIGIFTFDGKVIWYA